MIPWFGWAYLALLALVGLSGCVLTLRDGQPSLPAAARLVAFAVLMWAVVLYFGDAGAGPGFAAALFAAIVVLAHKINIDLRDARRLQLGTAARIGVVINQLVTLPAIAAGALALWSRHGA